MKSVIGLMLIFVFCSCGSTDRQTCDPGRQIDCTCAGGAAGFQRCMDDGSGWGECECACEKDCAGLVCGPDPECGESCGTCDTGEDCVSGACRCGGTGPDCVSGETCCDNECSDLDVDRDHCGDCSIACQPGEFCSDGACIPGCNDSGDCVGLTCCDSICVDLGVNNSHCGACGTACGNGETCVGGSCQCGGTGPDCSSSEICCGTSCHDPATDNDHCGGCSTACDMNENCMSGSCMCGGSGPDCTISEICCGTECFDPTTDDEHCGECSISCGTWGQCQQGDCVSVMPCTCNYDCGEGADGLLCDYNSSSCMPGIPPLNCRDDCDCFIGESCTAGTCVFTGIECTADDDCSQGEVCQGGRCVSAPCQTREDCSTPDCICNGGICSVPPPVCQNDEDCCAGYRCNFGTCIPDATMCVSDSDCTDPEYPRCINGTCTRECFNDIDCPLPGQACVDNQCIEPGCAVDLCPQGQWCDVSDGQCKPGCDEDSDCVSPDTCNLLTHQCGQTDCCGGLCDPLHQYCDSLTCQCVGQCQNDGDCPTGFECNADARCWCTASACPAGTTCNLQNGSCDPDAIQCQTDADCAAGWICNLVSQECESTGAGSEGDMCYRDDHCNTAAGLLCDNGLFCISCEITDPGFVPTFTCRYECSLLLPNCPALRVCQYRHMGLTGLCMPQVVGECTSDGDCLDPAEPVCETSSQSCVECTEDAHCDQYCECDPGLFVCRKMACYDYADPDATCHLVDPCYNCDYGSGDCEPAYDCPAGDECCQGYTCNSFAHCEMNLDCNSDQDCTIHSACNTQTHECEPTTCCDPPCGLGEYCDPNCQCASGCLGEGEACDPVEGNCCLGLRCPVFWPFCIAN